MAADETGHVASYDGRTWATPVLVDAAAAVATGLSGYAPPVLTSVACASSTYCVAADSAARIFFFDGQNWTALRSETSGNEHISASCAPGTTFCEVGGYWFVSDGQLSTWTPPTGAAPRDFPSSTIAASCPVADVCIGVAQDRIIRFSHNSTESTVVFPDEYNASTAAISCPTTDFCGAMSGNEESFLLNGTWTSPVQVDGTAVAPGIWSGPATIDCAIDQRCELPIRNGVRTDTPAAQGSAIPVDPEFDLTTLACPDSTTCLATDYAGESFASDADVWQDTGLIDPQSGLTSVSCGSESFCLAVGGNRSYTFDGSVWSGRPSIDRAADLADVTCTTTEFCAAIGQIRRSVAGADALVATYSDGSWQTQRMPSVYLASLSCSSANFCVALGADQQAVSWNGSRWSPIAAEPNADDGGLACPSDGFCVTSDAVYRSGAWHKLASPAEGDGQSLDCVTPTSCIAEAKLGSALVLETFNGSGWTTLGTLPGLSTDAPDIAVPPVGYTLTCATSSFCLLNGGTPLISGAVDHDVVWPSTIDTAVNRTAQMIAASCPSYRMCVSIDVQGATVWRTDLTSPPTPAPWPTSTPVASGKPAPAPVASPLRRAPIVTLPPHNITAPLGNVVVLRVRATGSPRPTVSWQRRDAHRRWHQMRGATKNRLRLKVTRKNDGRSYRAVFRNAAGTTVTKPAKLSLRR